VEGSLWGHLRFGLDLWDSHAARPAEQTGARVLKPFSGQESELKRRQQFGTRIFDDCTYALKTMILWLALSLLSPAIALTLWRRAQPLATTDVPRRRR
jgi:hypothetical protein